MYRHRLRMMLALMLSLIFSSLAPSAWAGGAALQFVPSDAMAVIAIDFDKLRTTALHKAVEQALNNEPNTSQKLTELKQETGFDVLKDIRAITVVATDAVLKDDDQFVVVIEATIDEAKMVKFIEKKDGKALPKKQGAIGAYYEIDNGKAGLAFRGKHVLIGGMATLTKALGKNDPTKVFPKQRAAVEKEMVWIAGSTTPAARQKLGKQDANIGKLETFAAGLSIPDGAKLKAVAHFSDASAADALAKLITQGLGELKKDSNLKRMGLGDVTQNVTVTANGADLSLAVDLTKAHVEKIAKTLQSLF